MSRYMDSVCLKVEFKPCIMKLGLSLTWSDVILFERDIPLPGNFETYVFVCLFVCLFVSLFMFFFFETNKKQRWTNLFAKSKRKATNKSLHS